MSGEESVSGWAIVEQMGHRRAAGRIRETRLAGAPVLRLDVPLDEAVGGDVAGCVGRLDAGHIYEVRDGHLERLGDPQQHVQRRVRRW